MLAWGEQRLLGGRSARAVKEGREMLATTLALVGWVAFGLIIVFWGGGTEQQRGLHGINSGRWFD